MFNANIDININIVLKLFTIYQLSGFNIGHSLKGAVLMNEEKRPKFVMKNGQIEE